MQVIDQINGSALFAQSAYSASVATKDNLGRDITSTYLTSHQSLDGYATTAWVNEQGYITEVNIPESATWNEVSTTVQTNSAQWGQGGTGGDEEVNSFVYNNSADILDVDTTYQENSASYITAHQDVSNKLDTTAFSTVSGDFLTAAPADMATTGDVAELAQSVSETYQVKGDYLTTADSANFYPANNPSSFVDEDWVTAQGYITGVDLSEYAKRDFVLSSIESATSGKLDVSSFASVSGDFLTTSFEIPQSANWEEATTAYEQNSGTYLTSHQSLEGYATEQWVGEQGYLTEVSIPESGNWNEATTTVQTNSSTWNNVTNKLDTTAFSDVSSTFLTAVDLTPYQTIEGMTAYQPVGDYYTTAEAETLSSMLSAAIDYVSANAGDEFPVSADEAIQYVQTNSANIDETVTEFQTNSSTYMVEPNLEYNAVNEISGYNGSAIAQYGAEKQWLTHDDTIVHVSNSAQYAFGVNLSGISADLARMMGVDETVLYSGNTLVNTSNTIALSEPLTAFKKFKVFDHPFTTDIMYVKETTFENVNPTASYLFGTIHAWIDNWQASSSGSKYDGECYYSANSNYDTILTMGSFINSMASSGAHSQRNQGRIYKVIGVGRKN